MVGYRGFASLLTQALVLDRLRARDTLGGIIGTRRLVPTYIRGDGKHRIPRLYGRAGRYGADHGMSAASFYAYFRFDRSDIPRLARALGVPLVFRCSKNGSVINGDEGLLVFLYRLAYPCRLVEMSIFFNRSEGALSEIIRAEGEHLEEIAERKLVRFDPQKWAQHAPVFAHSIYLKGSPLKRCWGFVDGKFVPIARPGKDGYAGPLQRAFFSGYKRQHGMQFQGFVAPNGLFIEMNGPYAAVTNDVSMFNRSELFDRLCDVTVRLDRYLYAFADCGYQILHVPLGPRPSLPSMTRRDKIFNRKMSRMRVSVEWSFGKITQLFAFCDFKKNFKLGKQPVGSYWLIAALLTNCHSCLYGNQTAQYFSLPPPSLEYYMQRL